MSRLRSLSANAKSSNPSRADRTSANNGLGAEYRDFVSLATEPMRAVVEAGAFGASFGAMATVLPSGDGHPVLVLPGFGASDLYTCSLRSYLSALGYVAKPWRLGRNIGTAALLARLDQRFNQLYQRLGQPISLVGHSLGGVYARELARAYPAQVRQVITLGSPFAMDARDASSPGLARLYRRLAAGAESLESKSRPNRLRISEQRRLPPPVPTTSIYSKGDGVVDWRDCLEQSGVRTENVEVNSSHLGMIVHPGAVYVVADRLQHTKHRWRKFRQPGTWRERWYASGSRQD